MTSAIITANLFMYISLIISYIQMIIGSLRL